MSFSHGLLKSVCLNLKWNYTICHFFFFYLKDAGGNRIYIATQGNLTFKDNIDKMSSKKLATFDELIFNKKDEEHMLNVY